MPKAVKIPREEIVRVAYEITREHGIEAATATAIAHRLGCSIHPVYYVFSNMENLREAVFERAKEKYTKILLAPIPSVLRTKSIGLNYIRFAKEYPHLFKLIFCTDRQEDISIVDSSMDENKPLVIRYLMEDYNITDEKQAEDIYNKIGIFCHGVAMMAISKSAKTDDASVDRLITEVFDKLLNI